MGARKLPRGTVFAIYASAFLFIGTVYLYFLYPYAAAGPEQPVPFSHRLHVNVKKLDCLFCHNTAERTRFAGLPSVDKCLYCHEYIIPEHPQIKKLKAFYEIGEPVPWKKVTFLPDHVYFSHQRHLKAGVSCLECHGDVEEMDRIHEVYQDPINGMVMIESPFHMGFCLECHQQDVAENKEVHKFEEAATSADLVEMMSGKDFKGTRAPTDCWTCHQ